MSDNIAMTRMLIDMALAAKTTTVWSSVTVDELMDQHGFDYRGLAMVTDLRDLQFAVLADDGEEDAVILGVRYTQALNAYDTGITMLHLDVHVVVDSGVIMRQYRVRGDETVEPA